MKHLLYYTIYLGINGPIFAMIYILALVEWVDSWKYLGTCISNNAFKEISRDIYLELPLFHGKDLFPTFLVELDTCKTPVRHTLWNQVEIFSYNSKNMYRRNIKIILKHYACFKTHLTSFYTYLSVSRCG